MTAAAFRLTPEIVAERSIHESCAAGLDRLLLPPAFWFSAAIGATTLSPQQAAALSRAGIKRGLPDLLVLSPDARGPRIFGIELKRHNGRLSRTRIVRTRRGSPRILEGQEDVFPKLEAAGMDICVAHSVDEMLAALDRWQIPLRSHHR
jgi:hypothetical protein